MREEDPVHWDPFLHCWVVTRYADVHQVLHSFSADRTPSPEQLRTLGIGNIDPIAEVMVKQMLFLDRAARTRSCANSAPPPSRRAASSSSKQRIHARSPNRLIDAGAAAAGWT